MNINPTNFELVVGDCDEAIALDKNYIKALNRRAVALESLERYEDSLRGEC
jgi:import receptor subunit TOM70